jgi:hypothetical protein
VIDVTIEQIKSNKGLDLGIFHVSGKGQFFIVATFEGYIRKITLPTI